MKHAISLMAALAVVVLTALPLPGRAGGLVTLANMPANGPGDVNPSLLLDGQGNIFGTSTSGGGNLEEGTVFELPSGSHQVTTLFTFPALITGGAQGVEPNGGLVTDGKNLYGTTFAGSTFSEGNVFEVNIATHKFTQLAAFNFGIVSNGGAVRKRAW